MTGRVVLPKYSLGVGDRFGRQAMAQLQVCIEAAAAGVDVTPVWNKSNREHLIIGSDPSSTRTAVDRAVRERGWKKPYFVDADHIGLKTVDRFLAPCDFFTIDVAECIGRPPDAASLSAFAHRHPELVGDIEIPNIGPRASVRRDSLIEVAGKYLTAAEEAGRVYCTIEQKKGKDNFVTEVSMDETSSPQTPFELLVILAALADENIPLQTIAPKFPGRFNKGVDYVGDVAAFEREFADDVAIVAFAVRQYGLPANLKLSVHSGSDKFSIYKPMHRVMKKFGAGVHLKTAGTTWLEELTGLAESGGDGLEMAKEIYAAAHANRDELCAPYASVIDIAPDELPHPEAVSRWTSGQFSSALRHDPKSSAYNRSFRQLLHVAFKAAAERGDRYLVLIDAMETTISRNVRQNLFERHLRPLFIGD